MNTGIVPEKSISGHTCDGPQKPRPPWATGGVHEVSRKFIALAG